MDIAIEQINKEEEELEQLNQQMKIRAQKFGAEFTPLSLSDFKLFKIKKARQTGNINYLQNILLEEIDDLQQRKNKIKQRIQQFYPQLKIQEQDKFFEKRENPDFNQQDVQIRENSWHLFGVDYMSNQLIRNYFHLNPHFRIQWINDSSCNIVFGCKDQAQQAILPMVKGEAMKDEKDLWYELPEYQVDGCKRKLYCRLATTKDVKKREVNGQNSQYYKWEMNKKKLGNYVKRKAHSEIMKTKGINRDNKFHKISGHHVKREKQEEASSSSEVENESEEMMAD